MKKSILTLTAALIITCSFVTSVRADEADNCRRILDTMDELHLSTEALEIEAGEIYQIDVIPTENAAPLGWEIEDIDLGQNDFLKLLEADEIKPGTKIKCFVPVKDEKAENQNSGKDSVTEIAAEMDTVTDTITETEFVFHKENNSEKLHFYVEGQKTGKAEISAVLNNPDWEKSCTHGHVRKLEMTCKTETVPKGTKALRAENEHGKTDASSNSAQQIPSAPVENPSTPGGIQNTDITQWLDNNSLMVTYDGFNHAPKFHLPDGYRLSGLTGNVNAGTYTETATVTDVSNRIIGTKTITYTIKPSEIVITHLYDANGNTISTDVSGVVHSDIVSIQDNGSDAQLSTPGRHTISTAVQIKDDKVGNYILTDGGNTVTKNDHYNVKGNNPWYEMDMDYTIDENSNQLIVNFYMKNLRTEQAGKNVAQTIFALDMCIFYDKDVLEYNGSGNNCTAGRNWSLQGYYDTDHELMTDKITGEQYYRPDMTATFQGRCTSLAAGNEKQQLFTIKYDIKSGKTLENSSITLDHVEYKAGDNDPNGINATYKADPVTLVVNKTDDSQEHEIIIERDPLENAKPGNTYILSEQEKITQQLKDYVSENMTDVKTPTPSDPRPQSNSVTAANETDAKDKPEAANAVSNTDANSVNTKDKKATANEKGNENPKDVKNSGSAKTDNPDSAKTDNPDSAKTDNSDSAKTDNPDSAKTDNPDSTKTDNSDSTKTDNSDSAKTDNSDSTKTDRQNTANDQNNDSAKIINPDATKNNIADRTLNPLKNHSVSSNIMKNGEDLTENTNNSSKTTEKTDADNIIDPSTEVIETLTK